MSSNGVFLICFDSVALPNVLTAEDKYFSAVGCYIDLIRDNSFGSKVKPKVMIVATKVTESAKTERVCGTILRQAQDHVASFKENSILLVGEVLKTCVEHVTRESLREQHMKFAALSSDPLINEHMLAKTPMEWLNVSSKLVDNVSMPFDEIVEVHREVKTDTKGAHNLTENQQSTLKKLKDVVNQTETSGWIAALQQQRWVAEKRERAGTGKDGNQNPNDEKQKIEETKEQVRGDSATNSEQKEHFPAGHADASSPVPMYAKDESERLHNKIERKGKRNKVINNVFQTKTLGRGKGRKNEQPIEEEYIPEMDYYRVEHGGFADYSRLSDYGRLSVYENQDKKEKGGFVAETRTMLEYFVGTKDFLWFNQVEGLEDLVITQPMMLVKSLRSVVCHNIGDFFQGVEFRSAREDLLQKGFLAKNDFLRIYEKTCSAGHGFYAEEIWKFLITLGIGLPLAKGPNGYPRLLIPCLIKEVTEKSILDKEIEMKRSPNAFSIHYEFNRDHQSMRAYHKMLKTFADTFLFGKNGGEVTLAFSQKVEEKRVGNVAGIQGFLKWQADDVVAPIPQEFNFLMIEYESTPKSPTESEEKTKGFSIMRTIKIYLEPEKGTHSKESFEIFKKLDALFSPDLQGVQRSLACKDCQSQTPTPKEGYFLIEEGIALSTENTRCSELAKHKVKPELVKMLNKPFVLQSLIDQVQPEDLDMFCDSPIQEKLEKGDLEVGQQIWIFHSGQTDRWNCMARINPYAHVVVYVGSREETTSEGDKKKVHEVVHVSKSWKCCSASKAKICREDLQKVIAPHNRVFLGHPRPGWQLSANASEAIARRALKCARKPTIRFDYDYK